MLLPKWLLQITLTPLSYILFAPLLAGVSVLAPFNELFAESKRGNAPSSRNISPSELAILRTTHTRSVILGCRVSGRSYLIGQIRTKKDGSLTFTRRQKETLGTTVFTKALKECKRAFKQPECSDKRDNDGDGLRDFPADPSCVDSSGTSEGASITPPANPTYTPTPVPPNALSIFRKPFEGDFAITNHFDHEFPRQFEDANGFQRTTDNEVVGGIDGHDGYDFRLPEGTPLLAVADGEIVFAGSEEPFLCPLLNMTTSGLLVKLRVATGARTFDVKYLHLSRLDVALGDRVSAGQRIGLSGNTGCSTGPHLHFEIEERTNNSRVVVDPFGWNSVASDPWESDSEGQASPLLWRVDSVPHLYREGVDTIDTDATSSVGITTVRWMGRNDDANPENEFVEFVVNPHTKKGQTVDLSGARVKNNGGDEYVFPDGTVITEGTPLKLFSGDVTESAATRAWRSKKPIWNNQGDCVQLFSKSGSRMYRFVFAGGSCPASGSTLRASHAPLTSSDPNTGESRFQESDMKRLARRSHN